MDTDAIRRYNRTAWDLEVERGNKWTVPVGPDVTRRARRGDWFIVLTPEKAVPRDWFPADLVGVDVLGLAAAGGQQGPVLAAAGARVIVFDNSPAQLARDREVADRDGLALATVEGDMADLAAFEDEAFDLIVHPAANGYVPDVRPVWRECFRVLRPGGALLAGFANPIVYAVGDDDEDPAKELRITYPIPYSDVASLSVEERQLYLDAGEPLIFGHTLTDQIGGQLAAGFLLAGFYEDTWPGAALSDYMDSFIATRAIKPAR